MARDHHFKAREARPALPPLYAYTCSIPVSPWIPKPYRTGAISYLWPGLGTELEFQGRLVPCGYQSHQEAEYLVHLVVTHQIELDRARALAQRPPGARSLSKEA